MERTYSSTEVCCLVGITYRQLDYWCRQGFIPGAAQRVGSGCPRRFDADQVEAFRHVKDLMDEIADIEAELDSMRIRQPARATMRDVGRLRDWREVAARSA